MSATRNRRPTVRQLVKAALGRPVDALGEPVWAVAGYCGSERCETDWHQVLVSTLADLKPIPTRLKCPDCGRYLSPRGHAPYQLREHWPVTGEIGGCPLHPDMAPTVIRERFLPESAGGFASRRAKKKYRR